MDKPKSNLDFRLMSLTYKFRDLFSPRIDILQEVGIRPGFHVLDYGCGPGSYTIPLAQLVGNSGKIFALDIHPLAIQMVQRIAAKKRLPNVETICSGGKTGLADESIDVALLYDIIHDLSKPDEVLAELRRVLKPDGILSSHDHHLKETEIISKTAVTGCFRLLGKGKRVYNFVKV